ncbi:L-cystine ABC transporter ATP-binding protein TcyN [Arhodomonas sp. AD133]|uniref:L-cystine ABC transporter ATP-binding protein TcyN n=1 Tax=Arhodomonas sp. AD133 TaxID=3415009 RepID=UPI003EBE3818
MSMIELRGLTKRFGPNEVLRHIDLDVDRGEVLAVVGPSGSGKTTLLRCLNCLEAPSDGRIRVGDIEVAGDRPLTRQKHAVRRLRQHVGFVFQGFNLFPHRTALENVTEGPIVVKREPRESAERRGRAMLERVGLGDKADAYPAQLSGGQQQRVAIARALTMEPDVILFDEPTSALDPELVGEVLAAIRDLAREHRTMVIVTHEMAFARDVADRGLFMADGQIVEQSAARDLFTAPREERTRRFLHKLLNAGQAPQHDDTAPPQ